MDAQHTQEPWEAKTFAIYDAAGRMILQIGVSADRAFSEAEMEANARRIVACVNACAGVPMEVLELMAKVPCTLMLTAESKMLLAQHDALLSAAKQAMAWWEKHQFDVTGDRGEYNVFDFQPDFVTAARDAIAFAEGGA